jgi:hypothetical protein
MAHAFTQTEPQNHQSENTWFTPKIFTDTLGPFDLDPCTMSFRPHSTADEHIEHDRGGCGLKAEWHGRVWLNPPYGKEIGPFIDKFLAHKSGVMLIFARMGSEGVQKIARSGAFIYCLRKRIGFVQRDGNKVTNAGTDSLLVFFDENEIERVKKFQGVLLKGII